MREIYFWLWKMFLALSNHKASFIEDDVQLIPFQASLPPLPVRKEKVGPGKGWKPKEG